MCVSSPTLLVPQVLQSLLDADTVATDATPHGGIGYKRHVISVPSFLPPSLIADDGPSSSGSGTTCPLGRVSKLST
jgi:hypothetical protein